ncbi:unnamed protein product [Cylindrotheca closterium]|uniref:Uncharacterized protein n=1 Tax=Cylindrotheca closterium TaxID=2856 RepID=A0AAD2CGR8_9STRA|nr:unnamed protein product [Cylindrotheca closterium]
MLGNQHREQEELIEQLQVDKDMTESEATAQIDRLLMEIQELNTTKVSSDKEKEKRMRAILRRKLKLIEQWKQKLESMHNKHEKLKGDHVNLRDDFSKLNQEKLKLTNFSNGLLQKEAEADAILMKEKANLEHCAMLGKRQQKEKPVEAEKERAALLQSLQTALANSPEPIPPFLASMNPSPVASTSSFTSAQPISSLKPPPVASQKPHSKHNEKA